MRKRTRRILAAMLIAVLLFCAAPTALAEGETEQGQQTEQQTNTLTVNLVSNLLSDDDYSEDIVIASITADLYLITPANKDEKYDTYIFDPFEGDFEDLQDDFDEALVADPNTLNDGEAVRARFRAIAEDFAEIILAEEYETEPAMSVTSTGESTIVLEDLADGLYLLVLRGDYEDKTGEDGYVTKITRDGEEHLATRAHSEIYEYRFDPILLMLPTKMDGEEQQYNTSYGTWTNELTVNIKAERDKLPGKLVIEKILDNLLDLSHDTDYTEPAIFVFDVIGRETDDESDPIIYRRQVAISFDGPGTKSETLEDIPMGTWVWVTEIYNDAGSDASGPSSHYKLVSSGGQYGLVITDASDPVQIVPEPEQAAGSEAQGDGNGSGDSAATETEESVATVWFKDDYNKIHRGGHGIENVFTFVAATDDEGNPQIDEDGNIIGDWVWTTKPEGAKMGGAV